MHETPTERGDVVYAIKQDREPASRVIEVFALKADAVTQRDEMRDQGLENAHVLELIVQ